MTPPALLLHAADNVLVSRRAVTAGERVVIGGVVDLIARETVEVGHKLARSALPVGAKVIKYGLPIGSITQPVAAGEWIHLHNMRSDYIDAHTRGATGEHP
jgi:SAF domain